MPESFDVVVLGAGPAGHAAAVTAAEFGKRVAIVEREDHPGGAAVNTGTVPSKTLRETAVALSGLRSRDLFGVDLSLRRGCTIDDFLRHERAVRHGERGHLAARLAECGVEVVRGVGQFADPHTITVTPAAGPVRTLAAEFVVIATGSAPLRPPGIPFAHNRVHDSDELLNLHELPRSIAVVGGGVIGCEYACTFAALGCETTLVDGRDVLLPFLDPDLSAGLTAAMADLGIRFVWNERVTACTAPDSGDIELSLSSGATLATHHALVCAGRFARTAELDCAASGLALCDKGRVPVDENYRTNVPNVYAVGDVIGFPALASTSGEQGRAAARHACGAADGGAMAVLPTGIYTIPEVSSAGLTEPQLKEQGVPYVVGRAAYSDVPRGKIIGDRSGFLKLLFREPDLKLVGVHVLGELATEVLHIGVMALETGSGAELFRRACFNYPTLGELYKAATHAALRRRAGG